MKRVECKIEIKEVETGEIGLLVNKESLTDLNVDDDNIVNVFIWEEGNYSCDCNRYDFFWQAKDNTPAFEHDDIDCSDDKFKVRITRLDTNEIVYDEF